MTTHDYAVAMALSGRVEMLRSLYPEFAVCIQPPKRGRGRPQRPPGEPPFRETRIAIAIEDVRRIRTIWEREYGHKNRRRVDGPTAEEIAAERAECLGEASRVAGVISRGARMLECQVRRPAPGLG